MLLDRKEKYAVIKAFIVRYRKAHKKEKGEILREVIALTGYNKTYTVELLHKLPDKKQITRKRISSYESVLPKLRQIWRYTNYSCGKLLVPAIPQFIEVLVRCKELVVTQREKALLLAISPATVDRLLKPERRKLGIKGRSGTKPGTLLKNQIPIKIFTPWNEQMPGFIEMDLVAHCGDTLRGEYIHTLDGVDIATGWSEKQGLMGKGEYATKRAYAVIERRFPFSIKGIDVDSGSEFINAHFFRMTKKRRITFTRGRAGKKNDQAHIEQKNYSTVRKIVGYQRFETERQLAILNSIYAYLSDYLNYFIPTFKLVSKQRIGTKTKRVYDKPKTPYQRVLEHKKIPRKAKKMLKEKYQELNPAALLREINTLLSQLTG